MAEKNIVDAIARGFEHLDYVAVAPGCIDAINSNAHELAREIQACE